MSRAPVPVHHVEEGRAGGPALVLMTPEGEKTMDEVLPLAFGPDDLRHVTEGTR